MSIPTALTEPRPSGSGGGTTSQSSDGLIAGTLSRLPIVAVACLALSTACVERTVSIRTEPEGARVYLNDQEIGRSPVTVPFTWYGDYEVIVRKDGYQTVATHHRIKAPWYQTPGIDLISECLVPFTIRDHHETPLYRMEREEPPSPEDVVLRADELRERAGIVSTEP
jgi:hypothetical protein